MEFKEYSNPEEKDYDINVSYNEYDNSNQLSNHYIFKLIELIGTLDLSFSNGNIIFYT